MSFMPFTLYLLFLACRSDLKPGFAQLSQGLYCFLLKQTNQRITRRRLLRDIYPSDLGTLAALSRLEQGNLQLPWPFSGRLQKRVSIIIEYSTQPTHVP